VPETAAECKAEAAVREALVGNFALEFHHDQGLIGEDD
jgi:hypothetical protein